MDGPAGPNGPSRGGQEAFAHGAQVAAIELGSNHDAIGADRYGATNGGRRFGNQGRDATVQDAVRLVHLGADHDLDHDLFGSGLDDFNTEGVVDVLNFWVEMVHE